MGMELKNVKKIPKTETKYIKNSLNVGIEMKISLFYTHI